MAGPPRRWIAPSTPPPPSRDEFAALTTASTRCAVMSPVSRVIFMADTAFHVGWRPLTSMAPGPPLAGRWPAAGVARLVARGRGPGWRRGVGAGLLAGVAGCRLAWWSPARGGRGGGGAGRRWA